jgi:hypothetical protein
MNTLVPLKGSLNFCDTLRLLEESHENRPLHEYLIFRKSLNTELKDLSFDDSEMGLLWGEVCFFSMFFYHFFFSVYTW